MRDWPIGPAFPEWSRILPGGSLQKYLHPSTNYAAEEQSSMRHVQQICVSSSLDNAYPAFQLEETKKQFHFQGNGQTHKPTNPTKKPTHQDRSKKNTHHKSIRIGKPIANWILSTGALDVIIVSLVAKTIQYVF